MFWFLDLGKIVRVTYGECLGPLEQEVSTMDLLKRIELRMEVLTQNLENLPLEKVKIAQRVSDNGFQMICRGDSARWVGSVLVWFGCAGTRF